jgi:DNA-directed RNA polymerase subunit M/transcription elongation factor TFIIS
MALNYDFCEKCGSEAVHSEKDTAGNWISHCATCGETATIATKLY